MTQRRHHRSPQQNGFSLLEILAVVVLLSVLAMVTVPAVVGWQQKLTLEQAVSELQLQASETRNESVRSGATWQLNLIPTRQEGFRSLSSTNQKIRPFRIHRDVRCVRVSDTGTLLPSEVLQIRFFPDGTVEPTILRVSDARGNLLYLQFDRLTGRPVVRTTLQPLRS